MSVIGIIAEYNPFHMGHLKQIKCCKKNDSDMIIAVMSGDFIQRGAPAIFNKYIRAKLALSSGVDLVLELPSLYATASAPIFANGGVSLLNQLGCVNQLCFGCETVNTEKMETLADFLSCPPSSYEKNLSLQLSKGYSFPKAREISLRSFFDEEFLVAIDQPNNILAIEYLIALKRRKSSIQAVPILREGSKYHEKDLKNNGYPSATAIRNHIASYIKDSNSQKASEAFDVMEKLKKAIPSEAYQLILENHILKEYLETDDFSQLLHYKLMTERENGFHQYADISPDLSSKIIKNLNHFQNYTQFCDLLKSKEITYTRISRSLLHILLNIKKEDYEEIKLQAEVPYARILGFRKEAAPLLSNLKQKAAIPIISKLADAEPLLSDFGKKVLKQNILHSNLYAAALMHKTEIPYCSEYERQIIILP